MDQQQFMRTTKYVNVERLCATAKRKGMTFSEAGPCASATETCFNNLFAYTAFLLQVNDWTKGLPVVGEDGITKMENGTVHLKGPYWEEGMKLGYRRPRSAWTFLNLHERNVV